MNAAPRSRSAPWSKGKPVGQKAPLKLRDIWTIRVHLQLGKTTRDLALLNLAIDSKLRACDLVKLRVADVANGGVISSRAVVLQQKTGRPVQFEITQLTRESLTAWIAAAGLGAGDFLFPTRLHTRRQWIDRREEHQVMGDAEPQPEQAERRGLAWLDQRVGFAASQTAITASADSSSCAGQTASL